MAASAVALCILAGFHGAASIQSIQSQPFLPHSHFRYRLAPDFGEESKQLSLSQMVDTPRAHYWDQPRGRQGQYSQTSYGLPRKLLKAGNLTDALAWTWEHPTGIGEFVWGTLIDYAKNIYIETLRHGVFKFSPDGKPLWHSPANSELSSLTGDTLLTLGDDGTMSGLDIETGEPRWSKQVGKAAGGQGDMVTAHNGVAIAAVDHYPNYTMGDNGIWTIKVIGVNASTGDVLWSYLPDCGLWNIMGVFPDEDTVNFMDSCGQVYRMGLFNGSLLWKHAQSLDSFTDGGLTLGPDGSIYTCSNGPHSFSQIVKDKGMENVKGAVRKYSQSGELIWETMIAHPCMNFPAVSPDGRTLVLSDGANVLSPPTRDQLPEGKSKAFIDEFYKFQVELIKNKSQLAYYGKPDLDASMIGYDTQTGQVSWQREVEPWHAMSFARDEERAYRNKLHDPRQPIPHCGPPHWGGPTIDDDGNVYMGRSDGNLYIYNPRDNSQITFPTNDGMLMGGVSFAPGLMVVPTCSFVYVFRY